MKILVLSDSHENEIKLDLSKYDKVIHLGDYGDSYNLLKNNNVIIIKGNCDTLGLNDELITVNNKKLLFTHGDKYRVKYDLNNLYYFGLQSKANIVFFGHTHKKYYQKIGPITFVNPGAYKNNEYVKIIDNIIYFYTDNEVKEKYEIKW